MLPTTRQGLHVCAALWSALVASPCALADDARLLKDLTSVIALLGVPCGQVLGATQLREDDHIATCQDGNRYRVFINAQGRVVAEKQG